jgi:uncharacterized membrane-anchored protein
MSTSEGVGDVGNPRGSLSKVRPRQPLGSGFVDNVRQAASADVLHGDQGRLFADGVDLDDVGMFQADQGPGFLEQRLDDLGVYDTVGPRHLEGHLPLAREILGQVDTAETTLAQDIDHAIAADLRARTEGLTRIPVL